ncbi:RHS repeat-associated core domain-containing protein [Flavihumibacter sp. UBA7668]|uniref:RHS repeat-associated core domain-containing protein n=1 Tax=Flavihumibacter sp. UBA7668 TaxID=1946542 RepID=UPI0025C14E6C|nr:RHS repeat-associated core domain-containing protein [Flavihumibacter sp. UBA7668]
MRIYDPWLGRFLSVDPLTKDYPWYTPYQFAGNKPIVTVDVDGLEEYIIHYKYEDGKATLLRKIDNGQIRMVGLGDNMKPVVYDKRTGKPMASAELGKVQYQYYDASGNRLNMRRNYEGKYVQGDNELMPVGTNNLMMSVYIGLNNPTYKDAAGEDQYDLSKGTSR